MECDNCDCKEGLTVINYMAIRNKCTIVLCRKCFSKFTEMVEALNEENSEGTTVIV